MTGIVTHYYNASIEGKSHCNSNNRLQRATAFLAETIFQLQFVVVRLCRTGCIVILLSFSLHLLAKELLLFRQVLLDKAVLAHLLTNLVKRGEKNIGTSASFLLHIHHGDQALPKKLSQTNKQTKATRTDFSFIHTVFNLLLNIYSSALKQGDMFLFFAFFLYTIPKDILIIPASWAAVHHEMRTSEDFRASEPAVNREKQSADM